jgi:hypothetical protein
VGRDSFVLTLSARDHGDDGRAFWPARSFLYDFCLEDRVPGDHLLRKIDAVLDLS